MPGADRGRKEFRRGSRRERCVWHGRTGALPARHICYSPDTGAQPMNQARQRKRASASKCPAVDRARDHYGRRAWANAYEAFLLAEHEATLAAEDIELLAMAAYLTGRDEDYLTALERAFHASLRCRSVPCARSAVRSGSDFACSCAARWAGASGWLARGQRLLDHDAHECAERGYLLLPVVEQRLDSGDHESATTPQPRRRHRRALSRCGSGRLCADHQQRSDSVAARPGRSRPRAARRDHACGHGGRAVAS